MSTKERDTNVEHSTALVGVQNEGGLAALALLPDDEFEQRLAAMKKGQNRIRKIKRELMTEGVHFGTIPNTDKPALLQPGAELLGSLYKLCAAFDLEIERGESKDQPPVRCVATCTLRYGTLEGPVVAIAHGSASTWEPKHRWRRGARSCPSCGTAGSIIKGKQEYGGGWLCFKKIGGCGAKFDEKDQAIVDQVVGDVENPDQHGLENTVIQIASKRAFVMAIRRATASSDVFTQEDEGHAAGDGGADDDGSEDPIRRRVDPDQGDRARAADALKRIAMSRAGAGASYDLILKAHGLTAAPTSSTPVETLEAIADQLEGNGKPAPEPARAESKSKGPNW